MKRLLFLILIALVAGSFLFHKITQGSGYVLISLGNTSIEMSFWAAVAVFLLCVGVFYFLLWIVRSVINTVVGGASKVLAGNSQAVQKRTATGLVNFMEGNWAQARKNLLKSVKKTDYPIINYLAASRASYEVGNQKEALDLLHQAEKTSPDSGLAVALTQARMQLIDKKYEQCLATLERAKKLAPNHPVVLDLLQQTYVFLEDWKSLKALLPSLKKSEILTPCEFQALQLTLFKACLISPAADIKSEWDAMPSNVKKDIDVITIYVEQLEKEGNHKGAESVIRKGIKRNWDDRLVNFYGRIAGDDIKKQLLIAETWLRERPANPTILLTLGRLSLRNESWDKARDYFEDSIKLEKSAEAYAELARLLSHLGEYEKSNQYYQDSIAHTGTGLPDLPLPDLAQQSGLPLTAVGK